MHSDVAGVTYYEDMRGKINVNLEDVNIVVLGETFPQAFRVNNCGT